MTDIDLSDLSAPQWGSHWFYRGVAEWVTTGFATFVAAGLANGQERLAADGDILPDRELTTGELKEQAVVSRLHRTMAATQAGIVDMQAWMTEVDRILQDRPDQAPPQLMR